jgi:hypothetical protein
MWEPRPLSSLWAFMACYRDSFLAWSTILWCCRVDEFYRKMRCFSILFAHNAWRFSSRTKLCMWNYVLFSVLVTVVKLLCMLHRVLCRGATSSWCEIAVVPILWFCLYVGYLLRICCVDGTIIILYIVHSRSQWSHGLKDELSSLAWTLVSWVWILLKVMDVCVCVYSVCVVLCIGSGLATA